jgi:hypothetical protein
MEITSRYNKKMNIQFKNEIYVYWYTFENEIASLICEMTKKIDVSQEKLNGGIICLFQCGAGIS